jgi:hypothetical protein
MSKPAYWLVWVNGEQHRFTQRAAMRIFVAAQKALGRQVTIKAVGF